MLGLFPIERIEHQLDECFYGSDRHQHPVRRDEQGCHCEMGLVLRPTDEEAAQNDRRVTDNEGEQPDVEAKWREKAAKRTLGEL